FGPLPLTMSLITSFVGGSPLGVTILGSFLVFLVIPAAISSMVAGLGVGVSAGVAVAADSPDDESSPPQAAMPAPSTRARKKEVHFHRTVEAAGQGLEPQLPEPESGVLPITPPRKWRARSIGGRLPSAGSRATLVVTAVPGGGAGDERMRDGGNGSIQLLEADPELGRGLDPRRVREMSPRLLAPAVRNPRGPWNPGRTLLGGSNPIGLLVLDGLLVREATVGDHPSAELLGPGDLLRAWEDRDAEVLLPRR